MARALLGYVGTSTKEQVLAQEVARLRQRVTELEAELAEARARGQVVLDLELNRELHRIAEAATPALT